MKNFKCIKGVTLIELMATVTVLGIVVAIGLPSFNALIEHNRLVAMTNDLNGTLQYARSEAVRRGGGVEITSINDDIENGVIIWVDDDGNDAYADGEELRILRVEHEDISIVADVAGAAVTDLEFSFNAHGEISLGTTLTLDLCDNRAGDYGRQLQLLVSGALRLNTGINCP
ncbi:GspH/FimT family pseudopilin [Microbulbifer sp. JMSA004]|uniref:GspH/FimT family pseudopilin n=1 Tax=unclassified Microbulbifer TaxID=2619833 RepID=UPI0024ADC5D2|nr:GspH/FimT family pseudopilin [Microbulbifer sp. VAAF005]WHI48804.1 GspH/FimT family pseudopilin [Microbulbifer sp. VAAF005]